MWPEYATLFKLLPPDGVFIDIGASTGSFSLEAGSVVGDKGIVVAVEPVPDIYAVLAANVELNGLRNVRCRSFCIGEETGESTLWMNRARPVSYSIVTRLEDVEGMSVLVISLDDLVVWERLERIDIISIDVPGAAEQVVAGGLRTIERFRPVVRAHTTKQALELPEYVGFRGASPYVVFLPREHAERATTSLPGWARVS